MFMETETMGRVLTEATIENLGDLWNVQQGLLPPEQVHRITVTDALVDSGATLLSLPTRLIQQLGLTPLYKKNVVSSNGTLSEAAVYGTVRLTIQGRACPTDVIEVPDNVPVLVGQIPLEYLDLVIDLRNRRLIGNPAHGGEHIFEMY
jgi:predicted aspartyl protease